MSSRIIASPFGAAQNNCTLIVGLKQVHENNICIILRCPQVLPECATSGGTWEGLIPELYRSQAIEHARRRLEGEILLAIPIPLRVFIVSGVAVVTLILIFLATSTYARQEKIPGWLVPHGGIIRANARTGGVVVELLAKEGDAVKAGQPLARLRLITTLQMGEDADAAESAALTSEAQAIRAQASASQSKLQHEAIDLRAKLTKLISQHEHVAEGLQLQKNLVTLAQADVERFEILVRERAMSPRDLDSSRAALFSSQQSLAQQQASELAEEQQIQDVNARLHAIPADLAVAAANSDSSIAEVSQKRIQVAAQNKDVVVASVAGRVLALPADLGQTLAPGATVAVIAPSDANLEAELYAPSRAVGFIRPGQETRLMYEAFPHEKFGSALGKVISVSRTILAPAEVSLPGLNSQQPVFRVRVSLADQYEHAYGAAIPLQPGMILSASIAFDRRSLFEWLLDPINAVRR